MKIAGIIAEYNPLHRGHLLPAEAARAAGATHTVAVMSGNFVQRGEPALCPWPYRVTAALQSGIDLVVQLPLPYAAATAEHFAGGAVATLDALGCVELLVFGSEAGELVPLERTASLLDSPAFSAALAGQPQGCTFAAARQQAVASLSDEQTAMLLSSPNNILGIEYLRALHRLGSEIRPLTLRRCGALHDEAPVEDSVSAGWLRRQFYAGDDITDYLPKEMAEQLLLAEKEGAIPSPALWERPLMAHLRTMSESELAALPDIREGLEHRLYRAIRTAATPQEVLTLAKSKRYTHARLRRILLAAALGIPAGLSVAPPPYLRVLGMTPRGAEILACAKKRAKLPMDASLAVLAKTSEEAARFAALEAHSADLYHTVTPAIAPCGTEYTQPLIKVGF